MVTASLVKELREKTGAGMLDCKKALEASNGSIEEAITWLREKGISKAAKKADRIAAEGLSSILIKGDNAAIVEVNSETDFVAKTDDFKELIEVILNAIIDNDPKTVEDVLNLTVDGSSINDLIIAKIAKIGEKISLRRFEKIIKKDSESIGSYLHMGGRIAVLIIVDNASEEVAKDIAMQAAAMRPECVRRTDLSQERIDHEKEVLKEQAVNEGKKPEIAEKMVEGRLNKFYQDVCLEEQAYIKDDSMNVAAYVKNNGGVIARMIRYEVGEGMEKRSENFAEEVAKQIGA